MASLAQNWLVLVFVLGVIGALALAMLLLREGPLPYQLRGELLPPAERALFHALHTAVRDDWVLFSRVPLACVLKVRPVANPSQGWQRRLSGKHLDYVLCDRETLEVRLAIQLASPESPPAKGQFAARALAAAGLPLVRVHARDRYEPAALRKEIDAALGIVRKRKRA